VAGLPWARLTASAELQERELIKLASWAETLAGALRERGGDGVAATLAAEAGIAVFRVAFDRWVGDGSGRDLPALVRESLGVLKGLAVDELAPPSAPASSL
jgi:hypothetical protein